MKPTPPTSGPRCSDAVTWFRERVPDLGLLVVGVCAGVIPAADLALADGRTRGFAAITPPMFPPHDAASTPRAPSLGRRVYRARRLPKRAYLRVRYGVRRPRKSPGGGALERAPGRAAGPHRTHAGVDPHR